MNSGVKTIDFPRARIDLENVEIFLTRLADIWPVPLSVVSHGPTAVGVLPGVLIGNRDIDDDRRVLGRGPVGADQQDSDQRKRDQQPNQGKD